MSRFDSEHRCPKCAETGHLVELDMGMFKCKACQQAVKRCAWNGRPCESPTICHSRKCTSMDGSGITIPQSGRAGL